MWIDLDTTNDLNFVISYIYKPVFFAFLHSFSLPYSMTAAVYSRWLLTNNLYKPTNVSLSIYLKSFFIAINIYLYYIMYNMWCSY